MLVVALLLAACSNDPSLYAMKGQSGGWTNGSVFRTVLEFVLLPLVAAVVISAFVALPALRRRNRYRPQEGWSADPIWFAGPPDPVGAVQSAELGDAARGGAGGSW